MIISTFRAAARSAARAATSVALVILTPLMEKNPTKRVAGAAFGVPMILSMSRLIVLGFAAALLHQVWLAGIAGWPDATLSIAVVLALPLLGALERAPTADVLAFAKTLMSRFGIGAPRQLPSVYSPEPTKYDDNRDDAVALP